MANIYKWNGGLTGNLGVLGNWLELTDGGTTFVAATSLPTSADQVQIKGAAGVYGTVTATYVLLWGTGTATVSASSSWTALDAVIVGNSASAADSESLSVNAALTVTSNELVIGWSSTGAVTIGAGGSMTTNANIDIANYGHGADF